MINGMWRTTLADGETVAVRGEALSGISGATSLEVAGCIDRQLQKSLLADLWAARMAEPLGSNLMLEKRVKLVVQREKDTGDLAASQAPYLAWPLIMLDRCVRGMHNAPTEPVYLYGTSPDWLEGEIEAVDLGEACPPAYAMVWLGDDGSDEGIEPHSRVRMVGHLSELQGHPRSNGLWRRAAVWFPVVGSEEISTAQRHDVLLELQIMVRPWQYRQDEEEIIHVVGALVTLTQAKQCKQLLREWRGRDQHGSREWITVVRFPDHAFMDSSWQFALVVADRIARGRDFCGLGKTVASGRILPDGSETFGNVFAVGAIAQKCELILRHAERHMRVLLPAACRDQVPGAFLETLSAQGAGCALVAKL